MTTAEYLVVKIQQTSCAAAIGKRRLNHAYSQKYVEVKSFWSDHARLSNDEHWAVFGWRDEGFVLYPKPKNYNQYDDELETLKKCKLNS